MRGLRRSWLSREVLTLSLFAGAAGVFAGMLFFGLPGRNAAGFATALAGLAGITCSARIYIVRARPAWFSGYTVAEFFSTALLLGPAFVHALDPRVPAAVLLASVAGGAAQLIVQSGKFLWLSQSETFELRSSSLLLAGRLRALFADAPGDPDRGRNCAADDCSVALGHAQRFRGGAGGRVARALPVLRQCGAEEHRRGIHRRTQEGGMKTMNWKRLIGLDNLAEEYRFERSESDRLHVGAEDSGPVGGDHLRLLFGRLRHGDRRERWTRGGVPAARVASGESRQALPQGPVGALHRSTRRIGRSIRCCARTANWNGSAGMRRSTTMVERFRAVQSKYGRESLGVLSTGQLVTEEFYTLGKLVQLGFGTNNYDGNTTLCMATAVSGYKLSFGSDGPPGSYEDMERADVVLLIGANIADNHPILCQYLEANRNQDSDRRRSARHEDRHDGGPASAAQAALGSGADQRHRAHSDSATT